MPGFDHSNPILSPPIPLLQKTHQSALQVQQKAEALLQANHYDMDLIRDCAESVASHWQQLMLKMEDRLKLVNASVAFYKTSEQVGDPHTLFSIQFDYFFVSKNKTKTIFLNRFPQTINYTCMSPQVCSVLESLEQEYKREEDWCGGADKLGPNSETDHVTPMISKHLEQKEAFLKVTYKGIKTNPNIVLSYISDLCVCVC